MIIDWYPGHMKKARAQIIEILPKIDLVIEVLDARLPSSSANPLLARLRGDKPCIKVLNKNDLADPTVTKAWIKHLEQEQGVRAIPLEAKNRRDVGLLPKLCRKLLDKRVQARKPLRILIVGIPNVGKSTLINTLAGKKLPGSEINLPSPPARSRSTCVTVSCFQTLPACCGRCLTTCRVPAVWPPAVPSAIMPLIP